MSISSVVTLAVAAACLATIAIAPRLCANGTTDRCGETSPDS